MFPWASFRQIGVQQGVESVAYGETENEAGRSDVDLSPAPSLLCELYAPARQLEAIFLPSRDGVKDDEKRARRRIRVVVRSEQSGVVLSEGIHTVK